VTRFLVYGVSTLRPRDKVQDWGRGVLWDPCRNFCELLIARMMICATARITGSEEWRKIGKKCAKIILKWNGSKK